MDSALTGESQTLADVMLEFSRNGRPDRSWQSFTWSPVLDETGAVNGPFYVTAETWARALPTTTPTASRSCASATRPRRSHAPEAP
ncbi:hypothetical protein AKJ13_03740 [Methylobacterium sp. ARG-1]|nr:hypothetical protein AKJ13_03740 [Methylobacterium sp. ARG-1]